MSRRTKYENELRAAAPLSHGLAMSPTDGLTQVILIGLSPSLTAHLMKSIRAVAPMVSVQTVRAADLGAPPSFADGSLLVVPDRLSDGNGVDLLRRLRTEDVSTPAILVITTDDFECPHDFDLLGGLDVIPLSEFSRFSFRRSLILLGSLAAQEKVLQETAGRLRAYERVLAAKDEERGRVLKVATALEHRLIAVEAEFQQTEASWAERVARADAYAAELEQRASDEETEPKRSGVSDESKRRQLALELAFHRDERMLQDETLSELRKTCNQQEQELRLMAAREEQVSDLVARLEASERVRGAQTQEILSSQRRLSELEQNLATIAALLETEQKTATEDPGALFDELAKRLVQVDRARFQHQGTIEELSRNLAVKQVDEALDDARSRRDVAQRIDEAVQRSRRLGVPLISLMIGIDGQQTLCEEHGSVAFDFILVQIAQRLHLTLRSGDSVMRYGEGQFLLITDAKSEAHARSHAERLQRDVCAQPFPVAGQQISISLSVAILQYRDEISGAPELIRLAKRGLREAQAKGERQIQVCSLSPVDLPPPGSENESGAFRVS